MSLLVAILEYLLSLCRRDPPTFGAVPRSSHWPRVRDAFIRDHPACEVCGTTDDLEAHHCRPFHLDQSLELDPANLMTLCRVDHYLFGHFRNWASFNESVRTDAAIWREKIRSRP